MSVTAQRQEDFCLNERSSSRLLRRSPKCIGAFVAFCSLFIAPAHGADLVGATAGELGVSPAGSASYSIPIAVPPGTTGLQPKITLQYDSLAGNGPAGMGWTVGGLATITRCPTSLNIDGTASGSPGVDPVDYDSNDKFCLNGQRLVPVLGAYGAPNTEYRTYQEEFSKVISYGTQGQGPQSFRVWRKSGEILEFGFTVDSRIEAVGRGDNSVWVWALNKLSDTYGNYETFSYTEDAVNGGFRISRINYTGNAGQSLAPYDRIDFVYASRSDPATTYQAGSKVTLNKRLTNIKVYADASVFRDYQITYEATPGLSGHSRPISIKECATDASGGTDCFPATTLQWSPDGQATLTTVNVSGGITSALQYYNVVASGDFNGDGLSDLYLARTSDEGWKVIQADKLDHVWLADGNGGFQDFPQSPSLPNGYVASSGDFNGDGLTDIYAYRVDGTMRAKYDPADPDIVKFSNGDGTFRKVELGNLVPEHFRALASGDFNGDGLTDVLFAWVYESGNLMSGGGTAPVVLLGNATGSPQKVAASGINISDYNYYAIPATGDFNGDGLTDLYVFRSDKRLRKSGSASDYFWLAKWTPNGSGGTLSFDDRTATQSVADQHGIAGSGDFNGDGLTDFYVIQMDPEGSAVVGNLKDEAWLATGDLRFVVVDALPAGDQMQKEFHVVGMGDFTGDGLTDLYIMQTRQDYPLLSNGNANDYIVRARGDGTFDKVTIGGTAGITGMSYENYAVKASGDFNGDGLTDLYLFDAEGYGRSTDNVDDKIFSSAWKFPDQLTSITNGLGLNTQLVYAPLTDPTVYTKGSGSSYPVQEVMAPRYVIAKVRADNGIGGQNTQNYAYEGLRAHLNDIGNLGFAEMTVTDATTGIITQSTYSQDWAAKTQGLLVQSKTVAPGNIVLEQQDMDWRVAEGPTSDGTPRLFRSTRSATTNKKDLNGAFISHGNEAIFYDDGAGDQFANYGFPRRIKVTTYGSASDSVVVGTKTTDNTYDHTESNWRLGRLRSATVTHQESGLPDLVRSSAFTYDNSKGVLASETVEPGSPLFYTKTYGYNSFGAINTMTETWGNQNRASIKNPDGTTVAERITRYAYDPRSRYKNKETNALDHTQDNAYDPVSGVLDSTTGPNGLTTTWGQDAFGRTTRENRADNTYTKTQRYRCGGTVSCPANAAIKIVTDVYSSDDLIAAPTETVYQDELYREVRKGTLSLDGREVDVDTIYDGQGRIKKKSEPFFAGAATVYWTTVQYDLIDRPVLTTRPDGSTQSVSYNGLTVTSTNELGQQKIVTKDALGRNARVTDDAGTAILYTYDALGELTQTRIAGIGNTASDYAYDVRGNKVSDSDPDKGGWTYEYNAFGLVSSQTDANGKVTTMTYDILGRMKTRTDDATAPNPGNRRSTWTYDLEQDSSNANGRLTQISGPGGYFKYIFYDNLQREKRVDETIEGTVYRTLTDYDTGSRVATVSYPSLYGQTSYKITNKYNGYGHLISVNDPGDAYLWRALADDARGNVTEFQLGAQVHSLRAYDNQRGWLKSIFSEKLSTHAVLQDLTYSFNTIGNLTRRADREFTTNSLIEDILYDANLNRLKKSTVTQSGTGGWQSTVNVGYDTLGNIASKSDVGTYTYGQAASGCGGIAGGKHAVTTIAGEKNATYCYDRNGNMLSGDGRTIAYTPYDLPQTITRGFSTVTFSYGPERARTKRVDSTAAGVTTTIYAAGRSYEKITRPDGSIEQKFYIGDFAVVTRPGTSVTPTDTIKYLLGDHLGSVDVIANANGTVAQKLSFDAWGKRREASWTVMIDPSQFDSTITTHGFTGHEEIDPVELVHMNGRVYDPEIGRFLSADPLVQDQSNSQSFNRYSYVLNNPLSLTDPTGFFFGSIFKAIGNFIGKVFSAIASVFKAVLKIPLIRAVIQIAACAGPELTAVCVGVTGAMELVAGGSIGDAIQAMAFTVVSFHTWNVVGDILHPIEQALSVGSLMVTGAVHGVVNGALSLAQGGTFLDGFASGAVGQVAGMIGMHSALGDIEGLQGSLARSVFAGAAGGAASELTGGKFVSGFATSAFAQMWNAELSSYRLGLTAEQAVARAIQMEGGEIVGTRLQYVLVAPNGEPMLRNGKPVMGEIDILYRDRFGTVNPVEVKDGADAKFRGNQLVKQSWVESGQVQFFGKSAERAGLSGKILLNYAGTAEIGEYQFFIGQRTPIRAMRQWFRYKFGEKPY